MVIAGGDVAPGSDGVEPEHGVEPDGVEPEGTADSEHTADSEDAAAQPEPAAPAVRGRRRRAWWAWLCVVFGVVLVLLSGTALAGVNILVHRYAGHVAKDDLLGGARKQTTGRAALEGPLNILLVGSDYRRKSPDTVWRSDTIIVLHVPASHDHAYLISFSRDTWVHIPRSEDGEWQTCSAAWTCASRPRPAPTASCRSTSRTVRSTRGASTSTASGRSTTSGSASSSRRVTGHGCGTSSSSSRRCSSPPASRACSGTSASWTG